MSGFGLEGEPLCFVELLDACLGRGSLDALNCVFFFGYLVGSFCLCNLYIELCSFFGTFSGFLYLFIVKRCVCFVYTHMHTYYTHAHILYTCMHMFFIMEIAANFGHQLKCYLFILKNKFLQETIFVNLN